MIAHTTANMSFFPRPTRFFIICLLYTFQVHFILLSLPCRFWWSWPSFFQSFLLVKPFLTSISWLMI
jgi:hypothetical protein